LHTFLAKKPFLEFHLQLGHWNSDEQNTAVDSFSLHIRKCKTPKNYAAVNTKDRHCMGTQELGPGLR
jgi:hypothetical protein